MVDHAADGREGLHLATGCDYDVLIVDRMLPKMDGLTLVKSLRGAKIFTPVLFLTTMSGIDDRVEGLEAGEAEMEAHEENEERAGDSDSYARQNDREDD